MDVYFKPQKCPHCSRMFSCSSVGKQSAALIPLLLPCGHSVCETCLKNFIKFAEPIVCKVCHHEVDIPENYSLLIKDTPKLLYNKFPINICLLGQLALLLIQSDDDPKENIASNDYLDVKSILNAVNRNLGVCVECKETSSTMCKECSHVLCEACFTKIHKSFQSMKNHCFKAIDPQLEAIFCSRHNKKQLEYFCIDCAIAICADCLLVGDDTCKAHTIVPAQEKVIEFSNKLKDLAPTLNENLRRLTSTAVDIGNIMKTHDNSNDLVLNKMIVEVQRHFSKLHAAIQVRETQTLATLKNIKLSQMDSLSQIKDDVAENIKRIQNLLNQMNVAMDTNVAGMNLSGFVKLAEQAAEIPWYLMKVENNDNDPKLVVNENVFGVIDEYIKLEGGDSKSHYKLLATKDIEEGVTIPPAPKALVFPPELPRDVREVKVSTVTTPPTQTSGTTTTQKFRPRYGSNTSSGNRSMDSYINMYPPAIEKKYPTSKKSAAKLQETVAPPVVLKKLQEGSQEVIFISHIVNPSDFYVQRDEEQNLVKELAKMFRNAESLARPSCANIHEGNLFLAFMKADKQWHRVRILNVDRTNGEEPVYSIFCIDFGIIDYVNIKRLRVMPPQKALYPPPLALHCCLANIAPINSTWTPDDSILMQKIINNKQAVIYVRQITSLSGLTTYTCDLITFEDGVNLAHALVFHERAYLIDPDLMYPNIKVLEERPKIFSSMNDFKVKSDGEEVFIAHIVSPDNFYIRKCYLQSKYLQLCEQLTATYNAKLQSGLVHCPIKGVAYAVQVGVGWRRAEVTALAGSGRVHVALLDTGETLTVHHTALRRLRRDFTTFNALAVKCHLDGVTPPEQVWSAQAVELLRSYQGSKLRLRRESACRDEDSLAVVLYGGGEDVICVNAEMVKQGHAISTGMCNFDVNIVKRMTVAKTKKANKKNKDKDNKVTILRRDTTPVDKELKARDKGPLKIEVEILKCESPSLLYVTLVDRKRSLQEMYNKIQEHFAKEPGETRPAWRQGERCCALCESSGTWRRGEVMQVEGDQATVFFDDFAWTERMAVSRLREPPAFVRGLPAAALRCRLSGVQPASGDEWPYMTREYLGDLVDCYSRFFISKRGDVETDCLPVELWVYHVTHGGALEPDAAEWLCLNYLLVEQGLAVRDVRDGQEQADTETSEDRISFLNITGSVSEWLQLGTMKAQAGDSILPNFTLEHDDVLSPVSGDVLSPTPSANDATLLASETRDSTDWLPPEPFKSKEFPALITYVDDSCILYLHNTNQEDTLDLICMTLKELNKVKVSTVRRDWSVGEPCVARYHLDQCFYRGRVIQVNQDTAKIHYIDYGNEETCTFENLRKSIPMHTIPIQAHRCLLAHIKPFNEIWTRDTLDAIHGLLVDKKCYVKIVGEQVDGITPIKVKLNKEWLHEVLVESNMATMCEEVRPVIIKKYDSNSSITQQSDNCLSDSHDFGEDWVKMMDEDDTDTEEINFITYPSYTFQSDKFMCSVEFVNSLDVLTVTPKQDDIMKAKFETLTKDMQIRGGDMPNLSGIYENKACLTLSATDNQWHRTAILEYSETRGLLKVRYVDLGDIEIVSIDKVREIDQSWVELPPACVQAKLYGVILNPLIDTRLISDAYKKIFIDKTFKARIMKRDEPYIHIKLTNEDGRLVYQNLIDDGIFITIDDIKLVL